MSWYCWLLVGFVAGVFLTFVWSALYVGGKADDLAERVRRQIKPWTKPEVIGWNGQRAKMIAEKFRKGDFPYASAHEVWLMKKGW